MRPSPLQGGGWVKPRSGSSVWLERSPVTAEVAGSSPVRFVLHEKRHTNMVCLFSCNYAPVLSHPQPRQVTMVHHAARMRLKAPVELLTPRQPDTSGWFTPCASKGRGGGRGFFSPRQGRNSLFFPAHLSQCTQTRTRTNCRSVSVLLVTCSTIAQQIAISLPSNCVIS